MTVDKILSLAQKEIGMRQGAKTVKYNTVYYVRESLAAWCAVFLWWLFREAGAPELYFSGKKTAYCPTLLDYYQRSGQTVAEYQPGDIIFFDGLTAKGFNDIPDHVGLCESFDGTYITTIDGNTSAANEANGGTVARRRRHKKYIIGAARPKYEEDDMASIIEQIAEKAGKTTEQTIEALGTLVRFSNTTEEGWEQECAKALVDLGLFSSLRDGRELIEAGELGAAFKNHIEKHHGAQ